MGRAKTETAKAKRFSGFTLLALVAVLAQSMQAQATSQLKFFKNYFVSGDYVVGGVGLRGTGGPDGFSSNTYIAIPDPNTPAMFVPDGADIVAAYLYWQTVEKSQSAFAGQNGFFNGYAISGKALGNLNAPVSWSAGGCAGNSNGTTTLRTYRADVRPFLPIVGGRRQGNGSFQVRLADSGSNGGGAPLTLGATLVIIYRTLSPLSTMGPLNAITVYDGSFAPSNNSQTMSQTIQGFYQAASSPMAKLTHIVGNGQPNKSELVYLNSVNLPSLYAGLPPFPGHYSGSWDNPTWSPNQYGSAVNGNDSSETTSVVPSATNTGCVSWGAVIFSSLVPNSKNDGLLDLWKSAQGYTDMKDGSFVALPGTTPGQQDLFIQIDYMVSHDFITSGGTLGHSHMPKQAALDKVGDAFLAQGIHAHFDVGNNYQNGDPYIIPAASSGGGNVIDESTVTCQDNPASTPPLYCQFPGEPATAWKGGFTRLKNQPLNYPDEDSCDAALNGACIRRFQHNRKDTYHELIFGHELGLATTNWNIAQATLVKIVDTGTTATVTTSNPHGLSAGSRVTVLGALADFDLNGTYLVQSVPSATNFTITTANVTDGTYSNVGLLVATGPVTSASGWSDLGGGDTLVSFGKWHWDDPVGCQPNPTKSLLAGQVYCNDQVGSVQAQAGTIMHEVGHTLGLTHGGTYVTQTTSATPGISAAYGVNCKPNLQSVMSYQFQIRGVPGFDGFAHVDFSGQFLPDLNEGNLYELAGIGAAATTYRTRWYSPITNNFLISQLNTVVGGLAATIHCNGTSLAPSEVGTMVRLEGPLTTGPAAPIDWNNDGIISNVTPPNPGLVQDINFNGLNPEPALFRGFNDWASIDLRQIGARRGVFGFSVDIWGPPDVGGDVALDTGGGGDLSLDTGGGGDVALDTGGGGDLSLDTGGGGDLSLDSGGGGVPEQDLETANSTVDPPINVTVTQVAHNTVLNWSPPGFGRIRTYYIWRANTTNGPISPTNLPTNIGKVSGTPPVTTFTDSFKIQNKQTYTYFVTAALGADSGPKNNGNQSGPSTMVTITVTF